MEVFYVQRLACCATLVLLTAGNPVFGSAQSEADSERIARQAYERLFQQDLARRRAAEAVVQARMAEEVVALDGAQKYQRLIDLARKLAAEGKFTWAIQTFNQGMAVKPGDVPVTAEVEALRDMLRRQNRPVEVTFRSDGMTFVTVAGVRMLRTFADTTAMLLPGDYEVVGRRNGYQEVRLPLQVTQGEVPSVVTVVCNETVSESP